MSVERTPRASTPAAAGGAPVGRRRPLEPEVAAARKAILEARASFEEDLDSLSEATRSAVDIPAKVRKDPVKAVALAGGAGFLLLGGPRRVLGAVGSRIIPKRKDPYAGLLPDDVERILRDTGAADVPGLREALARDFADYLRAKGKADRARPTASTSLWRTYDAVVGPLGTVAARLLVERLFAAGKRRPDEGIRAPKPR
jgi:hypothetical protein